MSSYPGKEVSLSGVDDFFVLTARGALPHNLAPPTYTAPGRLPGSPMPKSATGRGG